MKEAGTQHLRPLCWSLSSGPVVSRGGGAAQRSHLEDGMAREAHLKKLPNVLSPLSSLGEARGCLANLEGDNCRYIEQCLITSRYQTDRFVLTRESLKQKYLRVQINQYNLI